jgi:hypothetical protein
MGLPTGCSVSSSDQPVSAARPRGTPNPWRFTVERHFQAGPFAVLEVTYPDCLNFEGRKILVCRADAVQLCGAEALDPHFYEGSPLIARINPGRGGWDTATKLAQFLAWQEWRL